MNYPSLVSLREVAPRDGWQKFKTVLPTEVKRELICSMIDYGARELEIGVFSSDPVRGRQYQDLDSLCQMVLPYAAEKGVRVTALVESVEAAVEFAGRIGYPVIVRPAYTLGGSGGGIAYDEPSLREIADRGIHLSRVGQVLIERCISGWKEIEFEVMRDSAGNVIQICSMENIDPVGVHTGDSIVVAPTQTLANREYQMLRSASLNIISALGIEGGCNVQLALNPDSFEYAVIEVNPRVSRSSALASKATGYPIAKVAGPGLHPGRDPQRGDRQDHRLLRANPGLLRAQAAPPAL